MKTVGEILKSTRLEKKLSLEQTEQTTKIRKKFLEALENNDWQIFPSLTYLKGFLKNYSQFLGLEVESILAIFRRQFKEVEGVKVMPSGMAEPLNEPFLKITPAKIISISIALLVLFFFFWLFWQYRSFVGSPNLTLREPLENQVVKGDKLKVSGNTDPWANLTINGQQVKLEDGNFDQELDVSSGTVTIEVKATNKFNKQSEIKRVIKVENNNP